MTVFKCAQVSADVVPSYDRERAMAALLARHRVISTIL